MRLNINNKLLSYLIFILIIMLIIKFLWVLVSFIYLEDNGIEYKKMNKAKIIFYRIKLANRDLNTKNNIIRKTPQIMKKPLVLSKNITLIQDIKLLAIYNSSNKLVIVVSYKGKRTVLEKGEQINGFVLEALGLDYAIFLKKGKSFKLTIKTKNLKIYRVEEKKQTFRSKRIIKNELDTPIIPKQLIKEYKKDIKKIWDNISITDNKKNNKINGFKINYIKRNSDFDKIGLKKGDIIKAINGENLNNYAVAFEFYKTINSVEDIILTIDRNNQEMELEYEIK